MSAGKSPTQYLGVLPQNPPNLIKAERAPGSSDRAYVIGDLWCDTANEAAYMNDGGGSWIALGTGTTGAVVSLTGDSGGAIVPVAGNIDVLGDSTDGVSVVGTAGTLTVNIAAASTTQRGSLETSTDAESVTGSSTAVAVTPASLTARLAAPGAIGGTTPAAGAFTTVTASGDITTTAGNVIVSGAAKQLRVEGGAVTDFIGTGTLVNGVLAIANTNIAAGDRIFLQRTAVNASTALGMLTYAISAATSFTVTAIETATPADTEVNDQSSFSYFIVRQL